MTVPFEPRKQCSLYHRGAPTNITQRIIQHKSSKMQLGLFTVLLAVTSVITAPVSWNADPVLVRNPEFVVRGAIPAPLRAVPVPALVRNPDVLADIAAQPIVAPTIVAPTIVATYNE